MESHPSSYPITLRNLTPSKCQFNLLMSEHWEEALILSHLFTRQEILLPTLQLMKMVPTYPPNNTNSPHHSPLLLAHKVKPLHIVYSSSPPLLSSLVASNSTLLHAEQLALYLVKRLAIQQLASAY